MTKVLVTGGTVFVSRYIAEYYVAKGYEVYVLNRNTRPQSEGVKLIESYRNSIGDKLRGLYFDAVIDTAYTANDINMLLDALEGYGKYIFISSSAVYPETEKQPFAEESVVGANKYWGKYGTDKIEAETVLLERDPDAYILRPPYLYGQMNNVYREGFVFDCALQDRKFYLPRNGEMQLQFFHVNDLCRFMDIIIGSNVEQHIFNVGNRESVSVREWVEICYRAAGKRVEFINVFADIEQRKYFSFYDYEYHLDTTKQHELLGETKPLYEGLLESFEWYRDNADKVAVRPYIEYIDNNKDWLR